MTRNTASARVYFVLESDIRGRIEADFALHRSLLRGLLPAARIEHICSAVPGSLTKGDLDIQVCELAGDFAAADAVLAQSYVRNVDSTRTPTFSSFKDDDTVPPLGIQLTVAGGPENFFGRLRDYLIARPEANESYNQLKIRFEGASMLEYRAAKSDFLEALLAQIRYGDD